MIFAANDNDKDLYWNIGGRSSRYWLTTETRWWLLNIVRHYDTLCNICPDLHNALWREQVHGGGDGGGAGWIWKRASTSGIDYATYQKLCLCMEALPLYRDYDGVITELPNFRPAIEVVLFRRCATHARFEECAARAHTAGLVWTPTKKRSQSEEGVGDGSSSSSSSGGGGGSSSSSSEANKRQRHHE